MATSSCETLLASGHTSPGYYLIDGPEVVGTEQYEVVKCNMGVEPTDPTFEQTTGVRVNKHLPVPVAFDFRRISSYSGNNTVVPYEQEVLNVGGAMTMDGVFTAPVNGVYQFLLVHNKDTDTSNYQRLFVRVDQQEAGRRVLNGVYAAGGITLTLKLKQGQIVDVYLLNGAVFGAWDVDLHFTGHLIHVI